jgi:hypothetical protein
MRVKCVVRDCKEEGVWRIEAYHMDNIDKRKWLCGLCPEHLDLMHETIGDWLSSSPTTVEEKKGKEKKKKDNKQL